MTFQPPPPPPPGAPPPPPPPAGGYGAPPPGGGGSFDPKSVNTLDWLILGAGFFGFIFSTFSYYKYSFSCGDSSICGSISATDSAWHGFFGWFAALLVLAAAGVMATALFAPQVKLPVPARLATLGLFAVASLCVILAIFVIPGPSSIGGYHKGHGFAFWIDLILILGGTVLALMRAQQTNTAMPGALSKIPKIG